MAGILDDAYRRYYKNQTRIQSRCVSPNMMETKKLSERFENFNSIIDMLKNFKIDGNAIRDIWSEVSF